MTNLAVAFGTAFGQCRHGRKVCSDCIVPDDAARRAYDITRQIAHDLDYETRTRGYPWVAIRLSDGGSDGRSYATRAEAARWQLHEKQCFYFCYRNEPNGFASPKDAAIVLAFARAAYDAGTMPDPEANRDMIIPLTGEHMQNQLNRLANAAGWRR